MEMYAWLSYMERVKLNDGSDCRISAEEIDLLSSQSANHQNSSIICGRSTPLIL